MGKMLIVVDMLNDFCSKDGVLATSPITGELYAKNIVYPIHRILKDFRKNGQAIIFINDAHAPNDKEFEIWPAHAVKGTEGAQIIDSLAPTGERGTFREHVLEKTRYSGFFGTELEALLKAEGPSEVVVTGVCTSICVMDTVGGLANRDYNVIVPSDCVADFNPEMHDFSLKRMKDIYQAKVL